MRAAYLPLSLICVCFEDVSEVISWICSYVYANKARLDTPLDGGKSLPPPERQAPLGTVRQWQGLQQPKIIKHAVTCFLLYLHKMFIQVSTWEKAPASSLFFFKESHIQYTNTYTHPLLQSLFTHSVRAFDQEYLHRSDPQRAETYIWINCDIKNNCGRNAAANCYLFCSNSYNIWIQF